jgi:uncharacterized membrane protein
VNSAKASGGVIEMAAAVGDTVVEGTPVPHVFAARQLIDERELKNRIEIGEERTFEQDPKYAIQLLVDISIRALSLAVDDPTTALQALDQIEDPARPMEVQTPTGKHEIHLLRTGSNSSCF